MPALELEQILTLAPVIPVIVIDNAAHAQPIASALVRGGLPAIEVTLRTPAAIEAMQEMARVEGAVVGAGTVLNPGDLTRAIDAGAHFLVSPGLTEALGREARDADVPFLPGVASASEVMRGLDLGFDRFKFFPAAAAGGLPLLKAFAGPFGGVRFCPTGGITLETAGEWLALDNVMCVGGSWLAGPGNPDAEAIEARARAAAGLARSPKAVT